MSYRITLERNTLRFAAAHFTTFGSECEPLHGHNYDLFVQIDGELTPDSWVLDFSEAKAMARQVCAELDHKFLLPRQNRRLEVDAAGGEWTIKFGERRYVIPASDVAALEIDNSTAERLAEWAALRLAQELAQRGVTNVTSITVGVEEMPGQAGWYTLRL